MAEDSIITVDVSRVSPSASIKITSKGSEGEPLRVESLTVNSNVEFRPDSREIC